MEAKNTKNAILELEISPGSGEGVFVARVLRSIGGGQPTREFALDIDTLLSRRSQFETTVLASAVSARRIVSDAEATVQQVGRSLFTSVFDDAVGAAYRMSSAVAQERGQTLQLVLRLSAPGLAALPWESLYDPETGAYLCRKEPLVRNVPTPFTPAALAIDPPLRILGIVASPRGLQPLDTDAERGRLEEALRPHLDAGLVELVWLDDVTWSGVHEKLLEQSWHVLHFIGHGGFDAATDEGQLVLLDENGRPDFVSASSLADLLHEAEPTPRLVMLNSCLSGAASPDDLFSGTAAALVRSGIHAVAAMQFAISDRAAIAFSRGFYTSLAHGRSIDEAVRSGRVGILGLGRGTLEWVTPVLYLRGDDTRIFDITQLPTPLAAVDDGSSPEADPPKPAEPVAVELVVVPEPAVVPEPVVPEPVATPAPVPAPPPPEAPHLKETSPQGDGGTPSSKRRTLAIALGAAAVVIAGLATWGVIASLDDQTGSGAVPAPRTSQTAAVAVPAADAWTPTGLDCSAGDDLDITATGTVLHEENPASTVPPDGLTDPHFHQWNVAGLPDANTVSLIGRVGEQAPYFVVGSEFHGFCPATGPLSLGINDVGLEGNSGAFEASVVMTPVENLVSTAVVPVSARTTWTDVGLACSTGDLLRFVASGALQDSATPDRSSGPGGTPDFEPDWNVDGLESVNHAALIGNIAGQAPFVVGTGAETACPQDGQLQLGINDDGSDGAEHIGEFTVGVAITSG
ncbi:CHAT domain-containing protein [Agromyces sp. NPDC056379]|uniref:CHAT domain-containing protein n=1 Tax=unclassified Agromyces TaxID=2639701 RepID=UPI0035D82557